MAVVQTLNEVRGLFGPQLQPRRQGVPTGGPARPGGGGTDENNVVFRERTDGGLDQSFDGGRTWSPAPAQFQPTPQPLPVGQYPVPMSSAFEALGEAGYPAGAGPTLAGSYLADSGAFTRYADANSASGQQALTQAESALLNGTATADDINLLYSGGRITLAQAQKAMGVAGGTGGYDTGPGYLDLARQKYAADQQQRAFENTQGLTVADRTELGNRASAGVSLANYARLIANDQYERARDPGNFPALLAGYAGLEGAEGNAPLQTLLGQNFTITPPEGGNPLADPRNTALLGNFYDYAGKMNTDTQAVRDAYARYPDNATELFGNYARLDASRPQAFDRGGSFTADRPMRLEDYSTGKTLGTLGEMGPEQVTVRPGIGDYASLASGATGGSYTPSEGTNIALSKVLGPLGYPQEIVQSMQGGGLASPAQFNPQVLDRLAARNPSVFKLVMAAIRARLGGSGLEDYAAESERFRMRGANATGGIIR